MAKKNKNHNDASNPHSTLQVLDRQTSILYEVPRWAIVGQIPRAKRLFLCPHYHHNANNSNGKNSRRRCRLGNQCQWVHYSEGVVLIAPNTSMPTYVDRNIFVVRGRNIHVNWAWRSPQEAENHGYQLTERAQTDETQVTMLHIREPQSANSNVVDIVPANCVIKTKCVFNSEKDGPASQQKSVGVEDEGPLPTAAHCAHFYYTLECHRGAECDFAHVLNINASAVPWQLAPTPSQYGRTKHPYPGKNSQQQSSHRNDDSRRLSNLSPSHSNPQSQPQSGMSTPFQSYQNNGYNNDNVTQNPYYSSTPPMNGITTPSMRNSPANQWNQPMTPNEGCLTNMSSNNANAPPQGQGYYQNLPPPAVDVAQQQGANGNININLLRAINHYRNNTQQQQSNGSPYSSPQNVNVPTPPQTSPHMGSHHSNAYGYNATPPPTMPEAYSHKTPDL